LFGSWTAYESQARDPLSDNRFVDEPAETSQGSVERDSKRARFYRLLAEDLLSITAACQAVGIDVATGIGWARLGGYSVNQRPKRVIGALRRQIENQLRDGLPKKAIAEDLGVSRSTVSRVMRASSELPEIWAAARRKDETEAARRKWTALIDDFGPLGRKSIRSLEPAVYAWLYRNDRAWLEASQSGVPRVTNSQVTHVDWNRRDQLLAAELRTAATHLAEANPCSNLTLGLLCQNVPELKRRLGQMNHMPRTRMVLAEVLKPGRNPSIDDSLPLT
jgi:transcriptional regulator with XRE-family HTH domain